ncbi:unnamed protein product [Rotaria sp. Silwood1]|nr:unnamed protein product [Rotaria sp. Silwood1]CAF3456127.1 unnamed protein product [Rotaria sp. Silwood1]
MEIDDEEPLFRIRYIKKDMIENKDGYWEQYNTYRKLWYRLCNQCMQRVRKPSESLCIYHFNQENKSKRKTIFKPRTLKKNLKRLDNKIKRKNNKRKLSLETTIDNKLEQIVKRENEELNESLGIVISVSSSLNKRQIYQVKEFITKFHNESQSIQWTCESQPDYVDDTTTHLIANDSGSFTTILTKQIIQACVRHIFVGSINWIISSLKQSFIVDQFSYEILRDKQTFNNSRGIKQCRFDQLPVFPSSCIISVECHKGIKQLKMTRDELIEIVELSGGTLLNDYIGYEKLIIICNSKKEMINRRKQNNDNLLINEKNIYYSKPEFLFDSIVRHEVQAIEKYLW